MNRFMSTVAVLTVAGFTSIASAASVDYFAPFSISPIGATLGNPQLVSLPKFDTNLGTLVSVSIDFNTTATGTFTFVASDNPGDTADATLGSNLIIDFLGADGFASIGSSGPHIGLNVGDSVDVGGGGGGDPPAITDSDVDASVNPALYGAAGGGTFDVSVLSLGGWTFIVQGSGNQNTVTVSFDSAVEGEVSVHYEWIPEPASMALLGVGGLGLIARRRVA